jgi:hypothetical protein
MKRNVASQVVGVQLNAKADGSAVTSGTTTVYVTGDNGTQAAGSVSSGACTHKGHGYWSYAPAQAETDYAHVAFTFENSTGVNATVQIYTSFPQTADAPTAIQNADALLDRNMATGTDSGSSTVRTVRQALRPLRNMVDSVTTPGTMDVKKEDDSTSSWTAALTTDGAAAPIVKIDPAGP